MNRIDFLHILYRALDGVPDPARRDMLSDYEEHFRQAALEGRGEEETAASLGDPVIIAGELMAGRAAAADTSKGDRPSGAGNVPPPGWNPNSNGMPPPGWNPNSNGMPPPGWNPGAGNAPPPGWNPNSNGMPPPGWRPPESRRGCLSGCLLGSVVLLLNLIFILGPALGVFGVLLGAWCTALGISVGGLAALVASLFAFSTPGWIPASLSFATVLAGSVMLISAGMLLGMGLWYTTGWMFRVTRAYIRWTISLIVTRRS